MDMPEGWKRFCRFTESHALTGGGAEELLEIPVLIKEMAEALEPFSGKDGYEKVNTILTEFKEWK